jgi:3',5'-cyclic AMP phosphodiesterase CpdA
MSTAHHTRRAFLGAAAAAVVAGCGGAAAARPGSTLRSALGDPDGDGVLALLPGNRLIDRTELAPAARPTSVLAALAQVSDLHVRDAQSPGRVAFLDRLGPPFDSAFRPHEACTTQVVAATIASVNAARPHVALITGDLVDSAQRNELDWALGLLRGGTIRPNSGHRGYEGVQAQSIPDPLYYRPDIDAPVHPGLLDRAIAPVHSPGLRMPWHAVLGNHDILVAGELAPTAATRATATGGRLLVTPGPELVDLARGGGLTRDQIDRLLRKGLPGDAIRVSTDPRRTQLDAVDVVRRLRGGSSARLEYTVDAGDGLRIVVLDLVRRDAGAGGVVTPETLAFLQRALATAGPRHIIVVGHQPLANAAGAAPALQVLDADPRVVAVLAGHTHRNAIEPRHSRAGGYWLITTASIVDWPQQWRTVRLVATRGGGVAVETWMVDHTGQPNDESDLAGIARDLAFIDPQGGRPARAAGPPTARNVRLHLGRRALRPPRNPPRPAPVPVVAAGSGFGAGDSV